jgi:hypothetical protein
MWNLLEILDLKFLSNVVEDPSLLGNYTILKGM